MTAWKLLNVAQADEATKSRGKRQCGHYLAGDRCLLAFGHDGDHAVVDPTKKEKKS